MPAPSGMVGLSDTSENPALLRREPSPEFTAIPT